MACDVSPVVMFFSVKAIKATYLMVKSEIVKADIGKLGQCVVVY